MSKKTENAWRDSILRPRLKEMGVVFWITEAGSTRGLPDIVGVWDGVPVFLEVKRSESSLKHPRTVLQNYRINTLKAAGAFASFIYPENYEAVLLELVAFSNKRL